MEIKEKEVNGSMAEEKIGFMERVKKSGPAWMAAGLNIGGGTVTNSVLLAASLGMAFGYVFPLATATILFITYACVKITMVTGQNPIEALNRNIHPVAGWGIGIVILLVNLVFTSIQVVLGGAAINALIPAISPKIGGFIMVAIVAVLALAPSKQAANILQKVLKYLVYILSVSFLVALFVVDVDWGAFFKGIFVPTLPKSKEAVLLFTAVLGSALAINVPAIQAAASKAQGWGKKDIRQVRFETILTNLFLLFVQFAVMIVVGSTLFAQGVKPASAVQAALALEPLAGKFSTVVFCLGLLGALISTFLAETTVAAFTFWDMIGKSENNGPGTKGYKLVQGVMLLVALAVPLFNLNPFKWVSYGAAFNGTFMPLGVLAWWYLSNKKKVIGEHKAGIVLNIGLGLAFLVTVVFAVRFWYVTLA